MKRPLKTLFTQLAGLSSIGFVLAFASQLLLSYYFGTSAELDAYWLALAVVQVFTFYVGPAREALVPEIAKRSGEAVSRYFSSALKLILLCLCASVVLIVLFRGAIATVMVDAAQPELHERLRTMLLVMAPLALLMPLTELFNNVLVALHRLLTQGLVRIASSAVLIIALVLAARLAGINAAVAGLLLGNALALALLWRTSSNLGLHFDWRAKASADAAFFRLGGALLLAFGASQLYVVFERNTFTSFGEGVVSAYQYGAALSQVPQMVLVGTLATAMWPRALEAARNQDARATTSLLAESFALLVPLLAFLSVFAHVFAKPLIYVLFFRGAFDERSLDLTTQAFSIYVLALPLLAVSTVVGRVLVSYQAARQLAVIGIGSAVAGCVVLVIGRASGSLTTAFFHFPANILVWSALSIHAMRGLADAGAVREIALNIGRIFLQALAPALVVWLLFGRRDYSLQNHIQVALQLALDLVLSAAAYAGVLFALRALMKKPRA